MQSSRTYSLPLYFLGGNFTVYCQLCISFGGEHWKLVGKLYVETLFEKNGWSRKGRYVGTYIALQSSLVVCITLSISKWCLIITCLPLYVSHQGVYRLLRCVMYLIHIYTTYTFWWNTVHTFFEKRKNYETSR